MNTPNRAVRAALALAFAVLALQPFQLFGASHREAPITALDQKRVGEGRRTSKPPRV
jgi:hypothetical protein